MDRIRLRIALVAGLVLLMFLGLHAALGPLRSAADRVWANDTGSASDRALVAVSDAITISYWHQLTGSRETFLLSLVNEFNQTNPYGIAVQATSLGSYSSLDSAVRDRLRTGGDLPNVVTAYPYRLADYARYGRVRFLDEYVTDPVVGIDASDFYSGVLASHRLPEYGNQLASLPPYRAMQLMYYNADLLVSGGITVPDTWDAFQTACAIVTNDTVSGTVFRADTGNFPGWLWSHGGELISDDVNYARFDEQPGIDALVVFRNLIEAGYGRLPTDSYEDQTAFCNGQAAFVFGSSSALPYFRAGMEQGADQDWGVARIPAVPGYEMVHSWGDGLGIFHETEAADLAAWRFVSWLTDRDQTARWSVAFGYFPVRISAASHPSIVQKASQDIQYAQALAVLQEVNHSEPAIRSYDQVRSELDSALYSVFIYGAEITATLQSAATRVDDGLALSSPDSAVIPPDGGTLTYTNTQGLRATVVFPEGALAITQTVSFVPLQDLPTSGLAFALVPNLSFSQPVTLTLYYRDEDVAGMDEDLLILYTYDGASGAWVDVAACGEYVRDAVNNVLQVSLCHFCDYALLEEFRRIYLPTVMNSYLPE